MKNYFIIIVMNLFFLSLKAQSIQLISEQHYFPNSSLNGAYCPNAQDDQVGPGGYDFNGGMEFSQQNIWRIETGPESSTLYLDVTFSFTGVRNPNVYVRGTRSLEIFKYIGNTNSIVGFRQTRATPNGYTEWMNNANGNSRWTGDGDGGVFCEDDNEPDIEGIVGGGGLNNGIYFSMDIQGDTGGDDISTDRNCSCDTRVMKIYWENNIQIAIAPDADRDGIQDTDFFDGLRVDENIRSNELITKLSVEMVGNDIAGAIHNDDCKRFNGNIKVAIVNKDTNRLYSLVGEDILINWSNGNRTQDYIKRDLGNVQSSTVYYNVPRSDLDDGNIALILVGDSLKECHKNCDLCSGYRCDIYYQNSNKLPLENFINRSGTYSMVFDARIDSRLPNGDNHYLNLPIKISY